MKVRCIRNKLTFVLNEQGYSEASTEYGEAHDLVPGRLYAVLLVEDGWYRVVDESGEDYLYPPDLFVALAV